MRYYFFVYQSQKKEILFNGAAEHIKERIEVLCSESKLLAKEVTYLLTNNYKFS